MTTPNPGVQLPKDTGLEPAKAEAQKLAKEMAEDARYQTDRKFRTQADAAWKEAFGS